MLWLASSKGSINVSGVDSAENEHRIMSPRCFNSVHSHPAEEEHYFNVPQYTWSCTRHTAANMRMTYASWDCHTTSWPFFRVCFSGESSLQRSI